VQFVTKGVSLCQPYHRIRCSLGVLINGDSEVVDLSGEPEVSGCCDMVSLLGSVGGSTLLTSLAKRVASDTTLPRLKTSDVKLLPPITSPDKVLCIGMNYADHCAEQNQPLPVDPVVFCKFPSSITGPEDPVVYLPAIEKLDWEVELVIVIGRRIGGISPSGSQVSIEDAASAIAGYTVSQDISDRGWQLTPGRNMGQWLIGKSIDTFCPIGPALVTADEFPKDFAENAAALSIGCSLNGVEVQKSVLTQMVAKPAKIVQYCSRFWTLQPGDMILSGTPPGVGIFRKPPMFMKRGDVVSTTIEKIGTITTKIV